MNLEGTLNKRVKVVEKNGPQLVRLLTKSDHWASEDCNRPQCIVCTKDEDKTPNCQQTNLTYRTSCKLCEKWGSHQSTWGKPADLSGRGYRSTQMMQVMTLKELGAERDGWQHFSVKIVKTQQTYFRRQLHEAVTINMETGVLLNNLDDYSRCLVPAIEIKGAKKENPKAEEMRVARMKSRETEANLALSIIQETKGKRQDVTLNNKHTHPHSKRARTDTQNQAHQDETHMPMLSETLNTQTVRDDKRKRETDSQTNQLRIHKEIIKKRPNSENQNQELRTHKPITEEPRVTDEKTHTQEANSKEINTAKEPMKPTTLSGKPRPKYINNKVKLKGTETRDIRQFLKPKPESGSNPEIKTLSMATGSNQGPSNSIKSKSSIYPKLITRTRGQSDSNRQPKTSLNSSQYSICSIFKPLIPKSSSRTPKNVETSKINTS